MSTVITASALVDVARFFETSPKISTEAARIAINQTARRGGLKLLRAEILDQVAFPAGYLNNEKLGLTKPATNRSLEAVITARTRPTSLAEFVQGSRSVTGARTGGVQVRVKPGSVRAMPKAFLMRLRAGATLTAAKHNVGLAIRLKAGERVLNKREISPVQLGHNLYLLYAPSVDQVFRSVADEQAPEIVEMVGAEFFRQYDRLAGVA